VAAQIEGKDLETAREEFPGGGPIARGTQQSVQNDQWRLAFTTEITIRQSEGHAVTLNL
jgi:hypothetical protein